MASQAKKKNIEQTIEGQANAEQANKEQEKKLLRKKVIWEYADPNIICVSGESVKADIEKNSHLNYIVIKMRTHMKRA